MTIDWTAVGSLFVGASLVWMIFQFVIEGRDKARDKEHQEFYEHFLSFEERVGNNLEDIKTDLVLIKIQNTKLESSLRYQGEKIARLEQ